MAETQSYYLLIPLLILLFNSSLGGAAQYNVVNYGAKGDGKTDSTKAFQAAWQQACGSNKGATIYVPSGKFFIKSLIFRGPCKNSAILVRIDGTLVAPSDYKVLGNARNWLLFQYVNGVTVSGGVLDAKGPALWACKASSNNCPSGATSLLFANSKNIPIRGLTSLNSQMFHIVINGCNNVKIEGVTVSALGNSPNTEGIHVQLSSSVTILNSNLGTGDDCISIGAGTANLWIEKVACGPGHGISIGSLGKDLEEPGVQNVTVKTVEFVGTQNGARIKSWGRPSSGFARSIRFQDVVMSNVQNPIVIDQNYCPNNENCPGQQSGVQIRCVTYQNIHGTSATQVAVKFDCSKSNPCTDIKMKDVKLISKNKAAGASCNNADGTATGFVQPASCL